jgi:predicted nucleic acid-binding protein
MIRVVIETNILVSALLQPESPAAAVLMHPFGLKNAPTSTKVFLECAQAAEADYLVTGNHAIFRSAGKRPR